MYARWILFGLSALLAAQWGCALPREYRETFSPVPEILVFSHDFELLRRSPPLRGNPMDIVMLPDGRALVAVDGAGLAYFEPETAQLSNYFGPTGLTFVEPIHGRPILGTHAQYLVSHFSSERLQLLDGAGRVVRELPAPRGVHAVRLLENGNLLRVDADPGDFKVREVTPEGALVWESNVPLRNPYDAMVTPAGNILIADFDHHRMLELDRANRIVNNIGGLHHPRRFVSIADDYYLIADSDNRRIVAMSPDKSVHPLVDRLNRPISVAYDANRQLVLVGAQPFFHPTEADRAEITAYAKGVSIAAWLLPSLAVFILLGLWTRYREPLAAGMNAFVSAFELGMERCGQVLLVFAILLATVACWFFAWERFAGGGAFLAAALALTWASRYRKAWWFPQWPESERRVEDEVWSDEEEYASPAPIIERPWLIVAGLSISWLVFIWSRSWSMDWWPVILWAIGPVITIYGFGKRSREAFSPVCAAWLVAALAVALFFRLYRIEEIPYGLWLDEVYAIWNAIIGFEENRLAPFQTMPLVRANEFDIANLYVLPLALIAKSIGASFIMVKWVSILPSVGIVLGVYCLGKWSYGPWAGRIAAMIAAMNFWMVIFGRWGWLQQLYVMLAVFALAYFIRAYRWKCPRSAALCGLMLGLGFYTYLPILITTMTVATLFAIGLIRRERWLRVAQACIVFLMIAQTFAPLWAYYSDNPGLFTARANSAGIMREVRQQESLDPLIQNIKKYLLCFHVVGDANTRHNVPRPQIDPETGLALRDAHTGELLLDLRRGRPMLDPLTGGLLLLGLGLIGSRFYRPAERMQLLAFATALTGGILSLGFEAPNTFRLGVIAPLACLWAALPLASLMRENERRANDERPPAAWPAVILVVLMIAMAGVNYHRYFVLYPSSATWSASWGAKEHLIYKGLTPDDLGRERLFVHPNFTSRTFNLYTYFLEVERDGAREALLRENTRYTPHDIRVRPPSLAEGENIMVMPVDYASVILEQFPEAVIDVLGNPYGEPQALLARVRR